MPLGRREAVGMVWGYRDEFSQPEKLREILAVIDEQPIVSGMLRDFISWAANYYIYPVGLALQEALPSGFLSARGDRTHGVAVGSRSSRGADFLLDGWNSQSPAVLTDEQAEALQTLFQRMDTGVFSPFLLHGVTGSGKTEVYLRAVERTVSSGKTALVLVPEIAMTSQIAGIFHERFGDSVALMHSGMSDAQRRSQWWGIKESKYPIVVGTRSAIFAPLKNIGLIVVDEEHDTSYKQEERFRYNARDLALVRGKYSGSVVILGSATPAVTSYYKAVSGNYSLIEMVSRPGGVTLPRILVIDRREKKKRQDGITGKREEDPLDHWLSPELYQGIRDALDSEDQVLIFLNRRGYATFVFCPECGYVFRCTQCDLSLTWHRKPGAANGGKDQGVLVCHYCGSSSPALPACPVCQGQAVRAAGFGTERLSQDLAQRFPDFKVARLDRDAVTSQKRLKAILSDFRERKIDILVGTQMVTKGHDFPGLKLVGIVWADLSLNVPEFNAAERSFQLISQVSGRAGRRSEQGQVLVQTHMPDHYAVRYAMHHDYKGFFQEELEKRKVLGYPPFSRLINIRLTGKSKSEVKDAAAMLASVARERAELLEIKGDSDNSPFGPAGMESKRVQVLGPCQAPRGRLKGRFRYQFMLKGAGIDALRRVCFAVLHAGKRDLPARIRMDVDVDPMSFM